MAYANRGSQQYQQAIQSATNLGGWCGANVGLNLFSGNLLVQVGPPAAGPFATQAMITYNSAAQEQTEFGYGWTSLLRQFITPVDPTSVDVVKGVRDIYHYTDFDGLNYLPPPACNNILQQNANGSFTETQPDGGQLQYDSSGVLTAFNDVKGNRWTLTYSGSLVSSITDSFQRLTTFSYDGNNHLQAIVDPAGRSTLFAVTTPGELVGITSPDLCQTSLIYDGAHNLIGIKNANGQRISYTYDGTTLDRLSSVIWPSGGITTYGFAAVGSTPQLQLTDPLGFITTITGNLTGGIVTDPLGQVTTLLSGSSFRLEGVQDGRGYITTYSYSNASATAPQLLESVHLPREVSLLTIMTV